MRLNPKQVYLCYRIGPRSIDALYGFCRATTPWAISPDKTVVRVYTTKEEASTWLRTRPGRRKQRVT